jgi:hypothetical protein
MRTVDEGSWSSGTRRSKVGKVVRAVMGMLLVASPLCLVLTGCTSERTGARSDASPSLCTSDIQSGSDLTESSQYVEVFLDFGVPLEADGDVAADLTIHLDGDTLDTQTIAVSATVQGDGILVRLTPTEAASGTSASVYFALYDASLTITAASADGTLSHVLVSDDTSTCAILDTTLSYIVPSGVQIGLLSQTRGDTSSDTPASACFVVTQCAQLRCCTWLSLGEDRASLYDASDALRIDDEMFSDGTFVMKHNHQFLRDTVQGCASDLAACIEAAYPDRYTVSVSGADVTVTSNAIVDGECIDPCIVEGRVDE